MFMICVKFYARILVVVQKILRNLYYQCMYNLELIKLLRSDLLSCVHTSKFQNLRLRGFKIIQ